MTPSRTVSIEVVRGVEGHALYIGDLRIAGPKPWGGGKMVYKWRAKLDHIKEAVERAEQSP